MTAGVVLGAAHTPAARRVLITVFAVLNVAVFLGSLIVGWPTTARLAAQRSSSTAAALLLPVLVLGAAGVMLATLVLLSLPQLPQEKAMALRHHIPLASRAGRGSIPSR